MLFLLNTGLSEAWKHITGTLGLTWKNFLCSFFCMTFFVMLYRVHYWGLILTHWSQLPLVKYDQKTFVHHSFMWTFEPDTQTWSDVLLWVHLSLRNCTGYNPWVVTLISRIFLLLHIRLKVWFMLRFVCNQCGKIWVRNGTRERRTRDRSVV